MIDVIIARYSRLRYQINPKIAWDIILKSDWQPYLGLLMGGVMLQARLAMFMALTRFCLGHGCIVALG